MAIVLNPDENSQLERAVAYLQQGFPVALPTETVYGLAGNALDEAALASIFLLKNRPTFDPLIVHVLDAAAAEKLAARVSSMQRKLMDAFWPGPLTLLFEKNATVPGLCTAGTDWVAIRSPAHPVFRNVLRLSGLPLAAPSANRFGRISPVKVSDVLEELGSYGLEAVVDGGVAELGLESTVVKVHAPLKKDDADRIEIVRLGALPIERIREVVGPSVVIDVRKSGSGIETREAPGQLKSHYAPAKPFELFESYTALTTSLSVVEKKQSALLLVYPVESGTDAALAKSLGDWKEVRILSVEKSDRKAASQLFSTLRSLDSTLGIERIFAVTARPLDGLNLAINDRLSRAAKRS